MRLAGWAIVKGNVYWQDAPYDDATARFSITKGSSVADCGFRCRRGVMKMSWPTIS